MALTTIDICYRLVYAWKKSSTRKRINLNDSNKRRRLSECRLHTFTLWYINLLLTCCSEAAPSEECVIKCDKTIVREDRHAKWTNNRLNENEGSKLKVSPHNFSIATIHIIRLNYDVLKLKEKICLSLNQSHLPLISPSSFLSRPMINYCVGRDVFCCMNSSQFSSVLSFHFICVF